MIASRGLRLSDPLAPDPRRLPRRVPSRANIDVPRLLASPLTPRALVSGTPHPCPRSAPSAAHTDRRRRHASDAPATRH